MIRGFAYEKIKARPGRLPRHRSALLHRGSRLSVLSSPAPYGVIKIVGFFSEDLYCLAFRYDFAFGLLILVVGVLMLIKNNDVTGYLTPGLGWFTLLDSLFKIQMVKEASDFGLNGWNVILTIAIATGVISVLLIVGCFSSLLATKALVAGALLAEGCINFCVIQWAVSLPKPREAADKKEKWKENSP